MTTWTLRLAYPTLPLSLNGRMTWQERARVTRTLRDRVRWLTRQQQIPRMDAIIVEVVFTPRTNQVRDHDNVSLTGKVCVDGLRDYPARYSAGVGLQPRRMTTPPWTGIVADDDPTRVTSTARWAEPVRDLAERLTITISERHP